MKQTSLDAIRAAISVLLAELKKTPIPEEGQWVYERNAAGNWQGSFVARQGGYALLGAHQALMNRLSDELTTVLTADYPDHVQSMGIGGSSGILQAHMIIGRLAHEALRRFGSLATSDEQLDQLLADTAAFFDRRNIRLRLIAPVLNVHGPRDVPPIPFAGGIVMRPITDEEFTDTYGGNPIFRGTRSLFTFPDFVFIREIEVEKIIGRRPQSADDLFKPTQELLDRCILALSSFKDGGPVGYDGVRVLPAELAFGAAFGIQQLWGNDHVPSGHYNLEPDDAPALEAYSKLFENIHSTLEMACQRLVDATRRTKSRDSIVDAVIGLESMLLVEAGHEKQRGEMRFRFALNYAALFAVAERKDAFYTARDLYDMRSLIAHGGEPQQKEKINGKEMTLHEIAPLARSVLRQTLARFMPNSAKPDFLAEGHWVTKALGL